MYMYIPAKLLAFYRTANNNKYFKFVIFNLTHFSKQENNTVGTQEDITL